ncbi:hypothetical protein DSLASN_36410 [Desulfoluna limicola]|uniref:Uncharacterized protein n=1 Tax=Desulfoluna limicola TaxID=2810562 RepID=A0ABM7PL63_9BACT|nr:hypothetical protein DSLASN_36410 [Desulfoluna limicola]
MEQVAKLSQGGTKMKYVSFIKTLLRYLKKEGPQATPAPSPSPSFQPSAWAAAGRDEQMRNRHAAQNKAIKRPLQK